MALSLYWALITSHVALITKSRGHMGFIQHQIGPDESCTGSLYHLIYT